MNVHSLLLVVDVRLSTREKRTQTGGAEEHRNSPSPPRPQFLVPTTQERGNERAGIRG